MAQKVTVKFTSNFEHNLDVIEAFLVEVDAASAYTNLVDELLETLIQNLQLFPAIGRDFLQRSVQSVEALSNLGSLQSELLGGELREYLLKDYWVLYAKFDAEIYLMAIKHHQQVSFDFQSWCKEKPVYES